MNQLSLHESFPLLARNEGIWDGWYRHIDVDGVQIARMGSVTNDYYSRPQMRLVCHRPLFLLTPFPFPAENTGVNQQRMTNRHALYECLGLDDAGCEKAYRALFDIQLGPELLDEIRQAAVFSMPVGDPRFQKEIEEMVGRKLGYAKRGRPRSKRE